MPRHRRGQAEAEGDAGAVPGERRDDPGLDVGDVEAASGEATAQLARRERVDGQLPRQADGQPVHGDAVDDGDLAVHLTVRALESR